MVWYCFSLFDCCYDCMGDVMITGERLHYQKLKTMQVVSSNRIESILDNLRHDTEETINKVRRCLSMANSADLIRRNNR